MNGVIGDFPGDPVVKNAPANAEDTGLIPGLKDFIWCKAAKLVHLEPMRHNKRSHHNKKLVHDNCGVATARHN